MKFETKFGLGEIVVTRERYREDIGREYRDIIAKVVAIQFRLDCPPVYVCRVGGTGIEIACNEIELIGDPVFSQSQGRYLDE